jgi:hypothetical protein
MTRDKKIRAHRQAHANYSIPHLPWVGFLRKVRPKPSASQRSGKHHQTLRP